jgi:phosphoribosyl-dephospho-CoA transferase
MSSPPSSAPELPRRHDFIWLAATDLPTPPPAGHPADWPVLRDWLSHGRPLIVRRPCLGPDGSVLFAGLALPPSPEKRRLAFELPAAIPHRRQPPPIWTDCAAAASTEIAASARPVLDAAACAGLALRAFGSFAWQHLTGLPYVTATSDIDLLAPVESPAEWLALSGALSSASALAPRVDLEILLRGRVAFSWREYAATSGRILFKGDTSAWLGEKSSVADALHD